MKQAFIAILLWAHMLPQDPAYDLARLSPDMFWVGPHEDTDAYCWIWPSADQPSQVSVRDLPKCLELLQGLGRLDLEPLFIVQDENQRGLYNDIIQ